MPPEEKVISKNPEQVYFEAGEKHPLGKQLYQQKCAACHSLYKDDGSMIGVLEREPWTDKTMLKAWIRNPDDFMKANEYARSLKGKYGAMMPGFPDLTDDEINEIIVYLEVASKSIR